MKTEEKDYCIECGVKVFDDGNCGYCVPCGNKVFDKLIADKLRATNNVRPNHAVGEVYKLQTPRVHDPDNLYAWEERVPVLVWVLRVLGALGFMAAIYMLTVLAFLF